MEWTPYCHAPNHKITNSQRYQHRKSDQAIATRQHYRY